MAEPLPRLRSLYVCYLALDDPLVHTQVLAYLAGLAQRGHSVHLLSFEAGQLDASTRRALREQLRSQRIEWHSLRYHKRPSLPATVFDVLCGAAYSAYLIRRHGLEAFHARSHVPAAMGLIARKLAKCSLIFDIRGLMAEEFEDAGRWARGSVSFRLTKWVERLAIARAAGIVVLTERVRAHLFRDRPDGRVQVIPCCVDIAKVAGAADARGHIRTQLGLDDRVVLIYVGKLTGWYMEREMVEFFARARQVIENLHFLVLTQGPQEPIRDELRRRDVPEADYTIARALPHALPAYLAAADAAISLIHPFFSKVSSSPTKIGEYLAAGLPVVYGAGIGDVDALFDEYRIGLRLETFDGPALDAAAHRLARLLQNGNYAEPARLAAHERLSLETVGVPAYDRLYTQVASHAGASS